MKLPRFIFLLVILSLIFNVGWTSTARAQDNPAQVQQAPVSQWVVDPNVQHAGYEQANQGDAALVMNAYQVMAEMRQMPVDGGQARQTGLEMSQEEFASLKQQALEGSESSARPTNIQRDPADLGTVGDGPLAPVGPLNSFAGPTQANTCVGCVPPDPNLAVGPSEIVACVNSSFVGYNKTGAQLYNIPFSAWFSTVSGGYTFMFDPVCRYDNLSNRFVMVALLYNSSPLVSKFLVSVSTTSSATSWYNYAFDATLNGSTPTSLWADFPDVGIDSNAIYLTSNQFTVADVFQYSKIRILNKASLYAGINPGWHDFWGMTNPVIGGNAFTLRAAHNLSANSIEYFINSNSSSGTQLSIYRITNPLSSPPTFQTAAIATTVSAYSIPPDAAQPDTSALVSTGDARLLNAVMRDGALWTAHTISDGASPAHACVRWYQIDPVLAVQTQSGTFCSTGDYFFPALTVDISNNMGIVFSYVRSDTFATMRYTGRLATDTINSLQASNGVVNGLGVHTSGRWGDYGGAALDPNGSKMWFMHEFAGSNSASDWRTQIFSARLRRPTDTVGVFRPSNGALYLRNANTTGFADYFLTYGLPGDYPVVGDWNGDGTNTIGIYRDGSFYLRNSNTNGFADIAFAFGAPGDQPIAGDWNGDGIDTIGIYRSSIGAFFLRNSNSAGPVDASFGLGISGDVGIAGDWNGDGLDTTGVFRPSNGALYLKNANITGFADIVLTYGLPGDKPVTGNWNTDQIDSIGIYRSDRFYLRNSNTNGYADINVTLGINGDIPISGDWNGVP